MFREDIDFMYILQNAWKNIGRNKGRNILMAVIILAIIATSGVALIINSTASGIIDNYRQRFGSEVTISPNIEMLRPETVFRVNLCAQTNRFVNFKYLIFREPLNAERRLPN